MKLAFIVHNQLLGEFRGGTAAEIPCCVEDENGRKAQ